MKEKKQEKGIMKYVGKGRKDAKRYLEKQIYRERRRKTEKNANKKVSRRTEWYNLKGKQDTDGEMVWRKRKTGIRKYGGKGKMMRRDTEYGNNR